MFQSGLSATTETTYVGLAATVIGLASGFRDISLSQKLNYISDRLELNRVNFLQVKVNSGDAPEATVVIDDPDNLAPSTTSV